MSIAIIIAALVGFLVGFVPMLVLKRRTAAANINAVEAIDAAAWHEGFNGGWKAASEDFTNVRNNWKRMTESSK
jgi:hypothetical protein